jgi:hypothetical protein
MLVMSASHFVTREFFFTGTFVLGLRRGDGHRADALGPDGSRGAVWSSAAHSKAFVDYTDSGLENPLSYSSSLFLAQYLIDRGG